MTNFELLESGEGGHKKSRLKLGLYKKKKKLMISDSIEIE